MVQLNLSKWLNYCTKKRFRRYEKMIVVLLVFTFLLNMPMSVLAENPIPFNGIHPVTDDDFEAYYESLSEEEKILLEEKIREAQELAMQPTPRAVTKISIPGTYYASRQEETYYCAPACMKSMLRYLSGTVYTQDYLAGQMYTTETGTLLMNIRRVLNDFQTSHNYNQWGSLDADDMAMYIYHTIYRRGKPVLMGLENTSTADWYYNASGHGVVINAIYSDQSRIQIADPLGGWHDDWPVYYVKNVETVNQYYSFMLW